MITSLRLRGDKVQVRRVPSVDIGDATETCDGVFTSHDNLIEIRFDAIGEGFWRTLGHEIAHYHAAWSGLSAVFKSHDETGQLEEAACDAFGSMLFEVVRDNPELVAAMCEKVDFRR